MESIIYDISYESLFEAYNSTNKYTCNALEFGINLEKELYTLWQEIRYGKYSPSKSIAFIITDPKQREVFAANFRDRIVHHWICLRLESILEAQFISTTFNCRKGKGTLGAINYAKDMVQRHSDNYTKDCYALKLDLKGFFMSINRELLWSKVEPFVKEKYQKDDLDILLYLLKIVILSAPEDNCIIKGNSDDWIGLDLNKSLFTNGIGYGLPIGNLPSQMLGNFLLDSIDHLIVQELHIDLCRYVDDYLMIDKDKNKLLNAIPIIEKALFNNAGVKINRNKFYFQNCRKGFKFLGAVVKWDRYYQTNRVIGNLYKKIHKYNMLVKNNPNIVYVLHEKFTQVLNSYYGLIVHYNSYKIRVKIAKIIDARWYKTIYIASDYSHFIVRKRYKTRERIKRNLLKNIKYGKKIKKVGTSTYESDVSKKYRISKDEKV